MTVAAFTYLWANDCRASRLAREGKPLARAAGSLFTARGVGPGDHVYVITVFERQVYLVARLAVTRVRPRSSWDDEHPGADLWAGTEVVEGDGTPMRLTRTLPGHILRQLRFVDARGREKPLTLTAGMVDNPQSLRNVTRLSAAAVVLDGVLDARA